MAPSAVIGATATLPAEKAFIPTIDTTTLINEKAALAATESIMLVDNGSDTASTLIPTTGRYLVTSPYTEDDHLLDLVSLNQENQILALALTKMRAIREDYSTALYLDSFNWEEVIDSVRQLVAKRGAAFKETTWYIVAFRSRIKSAEEYPDLGALDKAAHAEAMASGGFLK